MSTTSSAASASSSASSATPTIPLDANGLPTTILPNPSQGKRIGLTVRNANVNTNGNITNSWFLAQALRCIGYRVDFLTEEDNFDKFEATQDPVYKLNKDTTPYDEYCLIIYGSYAISDIEHIYRFKQVGTRFVYFNCGNYYIFHQEEFVFGKVRDQSQYMMMRIICQFIDEIWQIPSYAFMRPYLETLTQRRVYDIPHLWTNEMIERQIVRGTPDALYYHPNRRRLDRIELIILEPNVNISKTSWLPLVIAERFQQKYPHILDRVHLFCFRNNEYSQIMISNLIIQRIGKLTVYDRTPMPVILNSFHQRESLPIFLSHQTLNPLNYIYYEMMQYGFPLVHNSDILQDHCYHYNDVDIDSAVDAIYRAHMNYAHEFTTMYRKNRDYLQKNTMYSTENLNRLHDCVQSVISRPMLIEMSRTAQVDGKYAYEAKQAEMPTSQGPVSPPLSGSSTNAPAAAAAAAAPSTPSVPSAAPPVPASKNPPARVVHDRRENARETARKAAMSVAASRSSST